MTCEKCRLHKTRRNVVLGRGCLPCDVLFVGEGPGQVEDTLGEPFVGASGRLLDCMLREAEGTHLTFAFTNVVLCHPTDTPRGDNRAPYPDEVLACLQYVLQVVRAASPRLVIFVGEEAERYLGKHVNGKRMLHPAALLRKGGRAAPHYDRVVTQLWRWFNVDLAR